MILLVLIVSCWTGAANAFYNEKSMRTLHMQHLNNGSLFGFSTAFHNDKRLIIGAPKADHIGQVYQCNVTTLECTQSNITIDDENKRSLKSFTRKNKTQVYPDWWLGATVATGSSFYVACAPMEFKIEEDVKFRGVPSDLFGSFGQCFIEIRKNEMVKLQRPKDSIMWRNTSDVATRMDSFGWSLNVAADDTTLVGGPFFQAQDRGAVVVYNDPLNQILDPNLKNTKDKRKTNRNYIGVIKIFYYDIARVTHSLGYSVATGNFFSTNYKDFFYAVGTTYGEDGQGMVLFFDKMPKNKAQDVSTVEQYSLTDDVAGSMFAAALCPASLDDDGRMDLLVGAPTRSFSESGVATIMYNYGAVHVYFSTDTNELKRMYTIKGEVPNGYFGFTIVSIGDMDGDKRDEVVIGAPYENEGQGAIYLYNGADLSRGTEPRYTQRIQGEGSGYFGFSLTPLKDFDNEGSYGLSVGMPANNSVAIVPFMMTNIKVDLCGNEADLQNRPTQESFVLESCLNLTRPSGSKTKAIVGSLQVSVIIEHEYAKLPNNASIFTYDVDLQNAKDVECKNITVLTPTTGDYSRVIDYTISVTQADDLRKDSNYNSSKALLLERPENTKYGTIWAATDCKIEGECKPAMDLTLESMAADPYMIGSTPSETIKMRVHNTGETAYSACVVLSSTGVSLQKIKSCTLRSADGGNRLVCSPSGPIRNNITWDIGSISLNTTSLTSSNKEVSITATIYNQCRNKSSAQTPEKITWNLTYDTEGVEIKGKAARGHIEQMTEDDIYHHERHLEHIYSILNTGPTKWDDLNFTIELEKQPYYTYTPPQIHLSSFYYECVPKTSQKNDSRTYQVTCSLDEVNKTSIEIYFRILIIPGTLGTILPFKNVTVSTNFTIVLGNVTKNESVTTTIVLLRKEKVPLWVLVAACLFGLALLGFISFILYECGCLRRKKKEDLKLLIRQTSVRMSMRDSARNSMATSSKRNSRANIAPGIRMSELRAAIAEKDATRPDRGQLAKEKISGNLSEGETNFDNVPLTKHEAEVHNDGEN